MNGCRHVARLALAAVLALLPATAAQSEAGSNTCARGDFRVILDVGHTAESQGAMSARGVSEFEFNLRLVKHLEKTLIDSGFGRTVLLVSTGRSIPSMYARVARVNAMPADLLLSIHHDSVPASLKEAWEIDGKFGTFSDRFKGHSLFISEGNADRKSSLLFASRIGEELKARGLAYTPHYTEPFMGRFRRTLLDAQAGVYRYDALYLLKKSRVPAALLEAGKIVNRDEELLLAAPERQELIAMAVAAAVEGYCAARAARKPAQVVRNRAPQRAKRIKRPAPEESLVTTAYPRD